LPYLSALEVCSRQGATQIHVYLYLYLKGILFFRLCYFYRTLALYVDSTLLFITVTYYFIILILITVYYNLIFIVYIIIICFSYRGTVLGNRYGPGTGPILMDNLRCVGNETSIHNCPHAGYFAHNCDHSEDVSVSCGTSPVHYGNFHNISLFSL